MSLELHIDPFSSPVGDVRVTAPDVQPDVSGIHFMLRIWAWLSQLCSVGYGGGSVSYLSARDERAAGLGGAYSFTANDAEIGGPRMFTAIYRELNRRERHMMARRKRGIRPASRYAWRGMGGPLPAGLSVAELRAWAQGHCRTGRFQAAHSKFYSLSFFSRLAAIAGFTLGLFTPQISGICRAPLSPD